MNRLLENHRALVTGSTSGIGRAIALRLAEQGARVVVTGRREAEGRQVVQEIQAAGGSALFVAADLEDPAQCRALVEQSAQALGGLDILVNNASLIPRKAGGASPDGPIDRTDEAFWDQMYRLGLRSVLSVTKYAVPHLLQSPHATVIHMSSALGIHGHGYDIYSTIKAALVGLTRSMATSYAHKIRVNCICPGMVVVERNRPLWEAHPEMYAQAERASLTRVGRPDDIAQCAVYLCSPAGEFVSGAVLAIDGGMTSKGYPLPLPEGNPEREIYPR